MNSIQEFERRFSLSKDRLVGEGGFGKVYLSYDKHLDLEVAIKKSDVKSDERYNLFTEYKRISKLPAHANIANYIACFRIKESSLTSTDFAVLQYYPLGNLKQLIKSKKLNLNQKHDLIEGILKGLKFLHENNIIHRDIKPPNILIAKRKYEDTYIPKITDFGISRIVNEFNEKSSIRTEFKMGQNEFTPPELSINKVPNLRPNADLYSAGMLMYFILTEMMPFNLAKYDTPEKREAELYQLTHKQFDPQTVLEKFNEIPKGYHQVLTQLLKVNPQERIKTAEQALALLPKRPDAPIDLDVQEITTITSDDTIVEDMEGLEIMVEEPTFSNTEKEAWSFVKISNSISALKEFIIKYPNSSFADQAKDMVEDLENKAKKEEEDWNLALAKNKLDDYDSFINKYPESEKAIEAKKKIFEISDEIAWKKAQENNTEKDYQKYIERFKSGNFVKNARVALLVIEGKSAYERLKVEVVSSESHSANQINGLLKKIQDFQQKYPDASKELSNEIEVLKKSINHNSQMFLAFDKINTKSDLSAIAKFEKQFPNHPFSKELDNLKSEIQERKLWASTKKSNTIDAYQNYIEKYPLGKFVSEAVASKQSIEEVQLWNVTTQKNTIEAYDNFIKTFPESKYSKVANTRMETLLEEQEWQKAKQTQYFEDFKKSFPHSKYIDEINRIQQSKKENEIWDIAQSRDSIQGYEQYIKTGKLHLVEARERLKQLKEEKDWIELHKNRNPKIEDYYQFAKIYPTGKYISVANQKIENLKNEAIHAQILSLKDPFEIAEKSQNYLQYQKSKQIETFYQQNDLNLWRLVDQQNNKKSYEKYIQLYPKGNKTEEAKNKIQEISSSKNKKVKTSSIWVLSSIAVIVALFFISKYFINANNRTNIYKENPTTVNLVNLMNETVVNNPDDKQLILQKQELTDSLKKMNTKHFSDAYQQSNEELKKYVFTDFSAQLENEFNTLKTDEFNYLTTWKVYPKCQELYNKWQIINPQNISTPMQTWVTETESDLKKSAFISITNGENALESFRTEFCNRFEQYKPTYETTKEIAIYFGEEALKNDTENILNACNKN